MRVLVTGSRGFVGKNLCVALRRRPGVELSEHDVGDDGASLAAALRSADIVFHLAGVNRPPREEEFLSVNAGLTVEICRALEAAGRRPKVVLASSVQAERDNPYGRSKRAAEEAVRDYCARTGAEGVVHRLKNLFGKWCRPNYNSVTATFCHNIARGLPIQISDPASLLELTYVDDVVAEFLAELDRPSEGRFRIAAPLPSTTITLGDLAAKIESFRAHRRTLLVPDFSSRFVQALYATYLSHVELREQEYALDVKSDPRGSVAEFLKAPHFGQIFVSRTKPGVTRGNHFHHTKTEKFMVVEGEAIIRLRDVHGEAVQEFHVRGSDYRVVDIPPGHTHSLENVGNDELVTLFWASEVFDPARPDTFGERVTR